MRLLNILSIFGLLITPNLKPSTIQNISSNATEFALIDYDDYYYNSSYHLLNQYSEASVDYSYYDNNSLNYTYMVFPYNLYSDTYNVYSIFVDFYYLFSIHDIQDILIDNHFFELQLFYFDTIPFTNTTNTLNFFKSIDNLGFDYYLNYDSDLYNGLIVGDTIHSYITFDNYINSESNLFIIMRISQLYFEYLLDGDWFASHSPYFSYLSGSNGFYVGTNWYNPLISLSNLKITNYGYDNGYNDGYQVGRGSINTQDYYDEGYQNGIDSVNVNAIYQNAYNDGYNVGIATGSTSYGITELLYSIFNIPVLVLSNLLSFTIFGRDMWGLIVSIAMLGVLLYLIRLIIKGSKPSE